jgi:hypothetical protein
MYTKEEVKTIKKYLKEERKHTGKRVPRIFRGGSSSDFPETTKKEEKVTKLTKKGNAYETEEKVKYYPCAYCEKLYKASAHSYEGEAGFNVCEECSIRRLPLDKRGNFKKDVSGKKSDYKPGVEQDTQLKPTAIETVEYKVGTQGYPQNVESFEEQKVEGKKHKRGRPRKYHTPEEKKEAHKLYLRKRAKEARKK